MKNNEVLLPCQFCGLEPEFVFTIDTTGEYNKIIGLHCVPSASINNDINHLRSCFDNYVRIFNNYNRKDYITKWNANNEKHNPFLEK
jgi:hypothetical protein